MISLLRSRVRTYKYAVFFLPCLALFALLPSKSSAVEFTLYAVDGTTNELIILDQQTAARTTVGAIGFAAVSGIAYDKQNDTLYGVDNDTGQLITIDRVTGAGTAIGSIGLGLANFPNDLGLAVRDLTFGPNNVLYGLTNSQGSTSRLITLDTATGAGTFVGSIVHQLDGLAYEPATDTMFVSSRFGIGIFEIDPANATVLVHRDQSLRPTRLTDDPNEPDGLLVIISLNGDRLATIDLSSDPFSANFLGLAGSSDTILGLEAAFSDENPPVVESPIGSPPICETTQVATVGATKTFDVMAFDPDAADIVTLNVVDPPVGAAMTPSLPVSGNPVSSTFTWTPDSDDVGTHVVTFSASSSGGGFTPCPVTIEVMEEIFECTPPISIIENNDGTGGIVLASVSDLDNVNDRLEGTVRIENNARFWLGVTSMGEDPLGSGTLDPDQDAGLPGQFAAAGLIPPCATRVLPFLACNDPGVAQWTTSFCLSGTFTIIFGQTRLSSSVNVIDQTLSALSSLLSIPIDLSPSTLVELASELDQIPKWRQLTDCIFADAQLGEEPRRLTERTVCGLRAAIELRLDPEESEQVQATFRSFGIDFGLKTIVNALTKSASNFSQILADQIVLGIQTGGTFSPTIELVGR